ncbi:extracellular solute-binding protein, partial [Mycobacterium sp. M1]
MEPRPQRRARAGTVLLTLAALTAAGCGSTGTENSSPPSASTSTSAGAAPVPATAAVSLAETGSTLLYSLFSEWGPAYQQQYPNVTISTADSGSGAGIAQVAAGAVDIGASDAYLSEGDVKEHPGLVNIALAISAQQVSYNLPGLTGDLKLNGTVLAGMYRGDIKTWNDPQVAALNPGVTLPATAVVPLHRSDGSG